MLLLSFIGALGIFLIFPLFYFLVSFSIGEYRTSVKSEILPHILSFLGDYKYSPICGINNIHDFLYTLRGADHAISDTESNQDNEVNVSVNNYLDSKIVPKFDVQENEDYISGLYNGVGIELFESTLQKKCSNDGSTNYETVFKGIFISLTMHKSFSGQTIVTKDSGKLGKWLKEKFSNLQNVKLEDPKFEKLFEVYSSNQIEDRYLLTTSFMERLLLLRTSFEDAELQCSFYNDKLLIIIPVRKNLFEPGSILEPADFVDDAKTFLREMNLIFSIIDILKLYLPFG